ncbi:hypothetical protein B0H13DRAFT_2300105 [Mycena leptocephala]|nr:hypothetical protein B0H13DRAFT_2300105 [Mycena leptocephala]
MLEFRGVVRKPGATTAKVIGDLYCVKDKVRVSIGAAKIKALAWESLSPKWRTFTSNFPLRVEDCQIYNKHWVEILPANPDINVISAQFYKPSTKVLNTQIFKTGKYRIDLCIPWAIYAAFEARDLEQQAAGSNSNDDLVSDDEVRLVVRTTVAKKTQSSKHLDENANDQGLFGDSSGNGRSAITTHSKDKWVAALSKQVMPSRKDVGALMNFTTYVTTILPDIPGATG